MSVPASPAPVAATGGLEPAAVGKIIATVVLVLLSGVGGYAVSPRAPASAAPAPLGAEPPCPPSVLTAVTDLQSRLAPLEKDFREIRGTVAPLEKDFREIRGTVNELVLATARMGDGVVQATEGLEKANQRLDLTNNRLQDLLERMARSEARRERK